MSNNFTRAMASGDRLPKGNLQAPTRDAVRRTQRQATAEGSRRVTRPGTVGGKVLVLECPNGHVVSVQPWGTRPASCPACVHGIPCGGPLGPAKRAAS